MADFVIRFFETANTWRIKNLFNFFKVSSVRDVPSMHLFGVSFEIDRLDCSAYKCQPWILCAWAGMFARLRSLRLEIKGLFTWRWGTPSSWSTPPTRRQKMLVLICKNRSILQWYPRSLGSVQTKMTNISKTKKAIFSVFGKAFQISSNYFSCHIHFKVI